MARRAAAAPAKVKRSPAGARRRNANVVRLGDIVKHLRPINPEIRYTNCFEADTFTSGVIAFHPAMKPDVKQIEHADKDVLCHVLQGRGRLRLDRQSVDLRPGTLCHIPKGTPHDFAAARGGELILFYSLIKTA